MEYALNSQQAIKETHLKLVFGLINEKEPISRADIKNITGLSATTVSSLVEELIANGLIVESGVKDVATSGRKAILLTVNQGGGYFAGVEVSTSHVLLTVYDLKFNPVTEKTEEYNNSSITDIIISLIKGCGLAEKLLGVTVGIPAIVDKESGHILSSTVVDIERDCNLFETLGTAFPDIRIALHNNSSLNAYAEKEFGNLNVQNLITIDISDGVGAGIVISGSIYSGSHGMAGEFGHVSIDKSGDKCKCGSYGCLELSVSIPAILKKAAEICGREVTLSEIKTRLALGSNELYEMLSDTAKTLSFGINSLINIIDPEAIVINGDISCLGDYFLMPLAEYVHKKKLSSVTERIPISYSAIHGNAVTLGGAKLLFDEMLLK